MVVSNGTVKMQGRREGLEFKVSDGVGWKEEDDGSLTLRLTPDCARLLARAIMSELDEDGDDDDE